jgi:hypothetical protein
MHGRVRNDIQLIPASHIEAREFRQLAELGRKPFEVVVADLAHGLGQITIHSIRISHAEPPELRKLADFSWQRRELVVEDLKARRGGGG